jgi:hypothetical protein
MDITLADVLDVVVCCHGRLTPSPLDFLSWSFMKDAICMPFIPNSFEALKVWIM